ncbi:hypothetical protein [Palleronia sp.]|uniref:hypothetical protein n=1 Tax=Palleronia sp. TaxID=1940284 RepID=UPI0035C86C08
MKRTLAAAALGLTLAVAPFATAPAQALNERQAAGIIAGAAILGLGAALAQNGNVDVQVHSGRKDRGYAHRRRDHAGSLPRNCLRSFDTRRGGTYSVFGQRCLARSGVNLRQLPRHCATDLRVRGRYRPAYEARCLSDYGWRVARHRY